MLPGRYLVARLGAAVPVLAHLQAAPHIVVFPGPALVLAGLAFTLFGDALNDALNPRLARSR